ncbi:MAG TPA: winged helix DNA-binding domain-containing protein [Actinocatenispora sp.]
MTTISRRAVNRALLARQFLIQRAEVPVESAVRHLVGLQAQAPAPPYVGLWTRLAGFAAEDLSAAMADRRIVRIVAMRGTIHTLTADDCLDLRARIRPVLERGLSGQFRGRYADLDREEVAAAGRALVEREPRTYAEIGAALAERWPDIDPALFGHVARTYLPLVQVTPRGLWGRGGKAAHTTAEHWLGTAVGTDDAPDPLVLRYLGAFGPASVADVQTWSGLTRLREVVDRLRPRLVTFTGEDGTELYDLPDAPRPDPDTTVPVRFLPQWDNLLLSHADRSRVVPEEYRKLLFASLNGTVPGTVLVDGLVRGTWAHRATRTESVLAVTPYRALSVRDTASVTAEGRRLAAFLSPDLPPDVRIEAAD